MDCTNISADMWTEMYNSVIEELWRIFSFYALHADPTQPEVWRTAVFMRFAKECQIVSKKLPPPTIELEIGKLAKSRSTGNEFNAAIALTFADFLKLLDIFAVKVYPKDSPESAPRRLLLENVLLLANRRVPSNSKYDLADEEAQKLLSETYGKCIMNIYNHYLDSATKRRNQLIAAERIKHKEFMNDIIRNPTNAVVTQAVVAKHNAMLSTLKEIMTEQKDLIGYKEYIQFCQDYSLKSTALLTAIQVGEVFLNLVPLNLNSLTESGMSFEQFKSAILYMSFIAYEHCGPDLKPVNKVKALLLFMWKAVNDSEKTMQMVRNDRSNKLSSYAGSLNLFGCGLFSDCFLANWIKDGFPDYTDLSHTDSRSGLSVLRNIADESKGGSASAGNPEISAISSADSPKKDSNNQQKVDEQTNLSLSMLSLSAASGYEEEDVEEEEEEEEDEGTNSLFMDNMDSFEVHLQGEANSSSEEDSRKVFSSPIGERSTPLQKTSRKNKSKTNSNRGKELPPNLISRPTKSGSPLILKGADILKLLQRKPELTEFLELQIKEMSHSQIKE